MTVLDTRIYSRDDQVWFAEFSGDYNPVHLDPIVARRELTGDVVVHGIHGALRALDAYVALLAQRGETPVHVARLKAAFGSPLYLEREVEVRLVKETDMKARIQTWSGGQKVADLLVERSVEDVVGGRSIEVATEPHGSREPRFRSLVEIDGLNGSLDLFLDRTLAEKHFPHAMKHLPQNCVADLLALTRLVGMECPGVQSLFAGLDVHPCAQTGASEKLEYRVTMADDRLGMVKMDVQGSWMIGEVSSFYRPSSRSQPGIDVVRQAVNQDAFKDQLALVVGGSRGLGETAAKIIAAGGGHPIITCFRGKDDADRVVREIRQAGGRCDSLVLDVTASESVYDVLQGVSRALTHIYYFPSPNIVSHHGTFDHALFSTFSSYYADGLERVVLAARARTAAPLCLYFPSTAFIDEPVDGFEEYIAAKKAGETTCTYLAESDEALAVEIDRLPRLATDQTLSLLRGDEAEPLPAMLKAVERCHALRRALVAG